MKRDGGTRVKDGRRSARARNTPSQDLIIGGVRERAVTGAFGEVLFGVGGVSSPAAVADMSDADVVAAERDAHVLADAAHVPNAPIPTTPDVAGVLKYTEFVRSMLNTFDAEDRRPRAAADAAVTHAAAARAAVSAMSTGESSVSVGMLIARMTSAYDPMPWHEDYQRKAWLDVVRQCEENMLLATRMMTSGADTLLIDSELRTILIPDPVHMTVQDFEGWLRAWTPECGHEPCCRGDACVVASFAMRQGRLAGFGKQKLRAYMKTCILCALLGVESASLQFQNARLAPAIALCPFTVTGFPPNLCMHSHLDGIWTGIVDGALVPAFSALIAKGLKAESTTELVVVKGEAKRVTVPCLQVCFADMDFGPAPAPSALASAATH